MSADNITFCPSCGAYALREYKRLFLDNEGDTAEVVHLTVKYSCLCRNCDFQEQFPETKLVRWNITRDENET